MRLLSALQSDIRFQFRHGFYYAYALVSVLYIIALRAFPSGIREIIATIMIISDPSVLGFFFVGGIILLERGQNILESLFVTPLRLHEYLVSKVLSLTLISVITCLAIALFSFGRGFSPILLVVGISLTSIVHTLLGVALAVRMKTLNQFLLSSSVTGVLAVPVFLEYLGFSSPLFGLFPLNASLKLISGAFMGGNAGELILSVPVLVIWGIAFYLLAYRWFNTYVILGRGEK